MTHKQRGRGARPAFTLIELLVVIAIIAILVSLTAAAVMRALVKGPELQTRSEIGELESKLGEARTKGYNNTPYLYSKLVLHENGVYTNSLDDQHTVQVLTGMFGRYVVGNKINWSQANPPTYSKTITLEGEQALVFYLGGMPNITANGVSMVGFSTNPANPAALPASAAEKRIGPYFEFQTNRLVIEANNFPVYTDPWKTGSPYAYFASTNKEGAGLYQPGDCASIIPVAPVPYIDTTGKWVNAGSFQIISAGRDGKFGAAGASWNPSTGTTDPNGKDDQSNFSSSLLGAGALEEDGPW